MVVESVEFALVTAANGRITTDPEVYFTIRNQTWLLIAKLIYNGIGAFAGGFLAARVAGYAQLYHGIALAAIQSLAFCWASTQPQIRNTTPVWMWAALIPLSTAGIVIGAYYCRQQQEICHSDVGPNGSAQMARQ
ncbi:MAG: YrzE family protein [Planctomycetaceae bacterium]|nr:YrzE family protein [Planctomycetaceae bacterium]MBT6495979.1 YrzE family protein [Planctomycetaceae bacterium]